MVQIGTIFRKIPIFGIELESGLSQVESGLKSGLSQVNLRFEVRFEWMKINTAALKNDSTFW